MGNRTHPLSIIGNLWRVFYLIIIPVLRSFLLAVQGDMASWVQGAWLDILVFLLMITWAVWRWWVVRFSYRGDSFIMESGLFIRKKIHVKWERITTISVVESFYLRPFKAAYLRLDTPGGSASEADFSIIVHKKHAMTVLERQRRDGGAAHIREYTPKSSSVLALSFLTSNSLGGILFMAAFVSQSGKLLGREFSDRLIGTFEEFTRFLAFGLPPAAAAIAYVLLGGWLISFLLTFFRYKNFHAYRTQGTLNVGGGLMTRRNYCIDLKDVNFIDIRQSVITKAMRLYSLYIYAVGFAKRKDDMSCIIPTESEAVFTLNREGLFPAFSPCRRQIIPKRSGIFRFVGFGLFLCVCIPVAMALIIHLFPSWRSFILFIGLMSMVPAVYFLIVRLVEWHTGGFSKSGDYLTMRYSKGFYLHTVVIPEEKIVGVELRQSLLQRRTAHCDLFVNTYAEKKFMHRCRNLNLAELKKSFDFVT